MKKTHAQKSHPQKRYDKRPETKQKNQSHESPVEKNQKPMPQTAKPDIPSVRYTSVDEMRKWLDDGRLLNAIMGRDHLTRHVDARSDGSSKEHQEVGMMQRVLSRDTTAASIFSDEMPYVDNVPDENIQDDTRSKNDIAAMEWLKEGLYAKMDVIKKWHDDPLSDHRLAMEVIFGEDDIVGTGFKYEPRDNSIQEYKTNMMTIVLAKGSAMTVDDCEDLQLPIIDAHLVTAYPTIEPTTPTLASNITPTGRDLSEIVKQTDVYQASTNPIERTYMELCASIQKRTPRGQENPLTMYYGFPSENRPAILSFDTHTFENSSGQKLHGSFTMRGLNGFSDVQFKNEYNKPQRTETTDKWNSGFNRTPEQKDKYFTSVPINYNGTKVLNQDPNIKPYIGYAMFVRNLVKERTLELQPQQTEQSLPARPMEKQANIPAIQQSANSVSHGKRDDLGDLAAQIKETGKQTVPAEIPSRDMM